MDQYEKLVTEFSKNLGVAFQILNDLKDWEGDSDNKLVAGQDVLAARPTLLLALALESLRGDDRAALLSLIDEKAANREEKVERVRQLFTQAHVFATAEKLIDKDMAMPPKKTLDKQVIADFTQWVQMGAPWPNQQVAKVEVAKPSEKDDAAAA